MGDLEGCSVYLDDVVVFSNAWDVHLHRIAKLFACLAQAGLTINLAKCEFAKATVSYLGQIVVERHCLSTACKGGSHRCECTSNNK